MSQREDAIKNFETGRIKALQEERLHIQKKTFTKWMNSFLLKARMEVEDLFTDLADGRMLLKLLEIISGEKLGKPNNGRMRVHKIENVNKSLAFLHTKVRLESIGAEDIVDGNPRLILGLIWTIILRFQIQEIEIDVDEENESSEKKSAKDALLLWCQRKTNGYSNVNIQDFTGSWRSGLGFNALIHAHRPDLIDFDRLNPSKHIDNLNNAFDVAETSLGIPRLLDAEDIDTAKPDEKSVLTYVASYYHTFAQMYNKDKSGRRIVNIVRQIKEADDLKSTYEHDGKALISWIRVTIEWLNSRDFPNNLEGVQKLLQKFTDHITVQKPPRYNEKSEIEANYFILNTRLKELNQHLYVPPEGLLVQDLEKAWEQLEKAEYLRELALREEVIRQTNLEQLAIRFEKKSLLREGYMKDMIQVLSDPRYGINLTQVEATLKKHEAISADILAREQRCEQLVTMADYLVKENYHDCAKIADRAAGITKTWNELINLLDTHKANLEKFSSLMQMMRDIDTLLSTIQELEENFGTQDVGVHLIGVEDLLQKHSLVESQISAMGDTIKRLGKQSANFEGKEREMIQPKIANMNSEYSRLQAGSKERRNKLEERRAYFQFVQDHEEEEAWVNEKSLVCGQGIVCKDLRGVLNLIGAHKMLLDEIKARRGKIGKVKEKGNELVAVWEKEQQRGKAAEITDVRERIKSLEAKWGGLGKDAEGKSRRLAVVLEAFQFYSDANETDSWVTEKRPLVASTDYGEDEPSAQALLQRHLNLEEEITAYENDVKGLNAQADKLVKAGINSIQEMSESSATTTPAPPPVTTGQQHHHQNGHSSPSDHNSTASPAAPAEDDVEYVTEQKLVPQEYFEDEVVEKTDYKTVTEERAVPQVKALYAFQGQDIEIKKGEVMFLLNKTNSDWWNVRKANGEDGFVPANYVKEVDPKVVMVQVRKPEVIRETTKVKKTRMVLQDVTKPVPRKPVISSSTGTLKKSSSTASVQQTPSSQTTTTTTATHPSASAVAAAAAATAEPILTRTDRINKDYTQIIDLSGVRKQNLQESIKLHQFLRECDDFEKWIVEKRKYLETPDVPNVQAAKRAFEQFLTDLTASSSRVSQIETLVEQFEKSGTTQGKTIDVVRERASKIRKMYEELLKLKSGKEKTLEGALSVELFNRTCEEVQDWMEEKMMQIDTDEWSNDLKTVQALQRRHNNVERELAPIQEKVSRVSLLAESVKKSYPNETENVDERNREVVSRWQLLKDKAHGRKDALENAVGLQIFVQGTKNLLHWIDGVKDRLNAYVPSRDVSSAEDALKAHGELGDDIKSKQHEFEELSQLGAKIQNCNRDVQEKLELLAREKNAIATGYAEKTDWLNQVLDLQMFLREADHIDSATRNQLSLVSSQELGSNLDEVESLLKRHTDTENTLVAQDERMRMFDAMGGKLVEAGHFEQKLIQERRRSVAERREQVKELAKKRKTELNRSQRYHEFCNDVEETSAWVKEKIEVAQDDSFKDLANVVKKIQKHEAFAGEVRANEVRIKNINRAGDTLQTAIPEKEREIRDAVKQLNGLWEQLVLLSAEKADKLRQAEAQAGFNKNLDAVVDRLASIKSNVNTECAVNDRRSCKDAVKRANSLSTDLAAVESKIGELERVADDMEKENHFDRARIRNRVEEAKDLMSELKAPVDNLKRELDDKYSYYSFLHELDAEASWISEKRALVEQQTTIHDLYQAQTIHKKHQKLEQEVLNREPIVTRLLERGKEHVLHEHVAGKLEVFRGQWEALKAACTDKSKRLDLALKSQQFFFDAGEIVNWMSMKEDALTTPITSKDIHSAVKLLTKQKTLELEMDSYSGIVQEMKHMANAMVSAGHPDRALISAKSNALDDHMSLLRRIANERREKLIHAVHTLEYLQEADEFLKYIDEVFGREVGSNEFGQDYEHLQILQARFKDVELKVEGVNDRFKTLEEMGRKLDHHQGGGGLPASTNSTDEVAVSGSEIGERTVAQTSEELREKWNTMLSLMAAREQKLHAAGEIHAFNRDVSDAIARIQEKLTSISDTVGRDVNSCESMLRENEAFETDLLALEAQLQVLVDDASRLQSLYPSNAQNIREEQAIVIESWNNLQTKATLRKDQLQNAVDFWRFSAEYGSSTAFINSLLTTMPSQPKVRDTASSQALMSEHEMIKGEIDAREDQFTRVFQLGQVMVEENHPESAENVSKMLANLRHLKEKLLVTWETKKVYLDQLIDLNIFLRDAKQLETVCNSQETQLGNLDLGDSVDEAYKAKKKHEAFEKLIQTQDEKFRLLDSQGKKLVKQHHFDSETVNQRLAEVAAAREKVKALSATKREAIKQKLKLVRFVRDVLETTAWVDEKVKKLKSGSDQSPATGNSGLNLQDKIKKLKKHQSLSAEISSNKSRVEDLFRTAKELRAEQEVRELRDRWAELCDLMVTHNKGLEEAYDILEFTNQCEQTIAWVREKESLVHAGDTGNDYEHCTEIIKRLDDVDSGIKVDDQRIKGLNLLADKLISVTGDTDGVIGRTREGLNDRWVALKGNLENYRVKLNQALETHKYNRDAEEVEERIGSKLPQLQVTDVGRDLEHVEALNRKQDAIEAQVHAVAQRVKDLETEKSRLIDELGVDESLLKTLESQWLEVSEATLKRRDALTSSLEYHKFLKKFTDLARYVQHVQDKLANKQLGGNVQEAENAAKRHRELRAEVNARDPLFAEVVKIGKRHIVEKHEYSTEFGKRVSELEEMRSSLGESLAAMETKLNQSLQQQRLFAKIHEIEQEIEFQESSLNRSDLGESLGAVTLLVRNHEEFTKQFGGIEAKVSEVIAEGEALIQPGHFDGPAISRRCADVTSKLERLKAKARDRAEKLHQSYELHKFVLEINEVESYELEKLKIATDDNYSDMSNLQSKIQRHAAFESEVIANEPRLTVINDRAEKLLSNLDDESNSLHSFMVQIGDRLEGIHTIWKELLASTALKGFRLQESYQALLFNQNLDDIELWMDELENQLESEDHGTDLDSVDALINKWKHLESEFEHKAEVIASVAATAEAFTKAKHYMADEIVERVQKIRSRYTSMSEPLHIRRENLDETLKFYEFLRDVGEEVGWVEERGPAVSVDADLGANLTQVQTLSKKHNQLESEIISHEPLIASLQTRASGMVKLGHFASDQITEKVQSLADKFRELKDSAALRRIRLADSFQSQMFYDEANELLLWMGEKATYTRNVECKEHENVSGLLKRMEAFQRDVANFKARIERVQKTGEELIARNHFDSENIQKKIAEVTHEYSELQKTSDRKRNRLLDAQKFYEFNRVCNETVDWINEQMNIAGSEEYGRDLEHCEQILQKFESFMGNVQESRAGVVQNLADELAAEGYQEEKIGQKAAEVKAMWEEFKELAAARLEALQGAKQVHSFDRIADETIAWINEKYAVVCSEDFGHDLESIQGLIRRHQVFENDLKPVEAKVNEVKSEADRLRNLFVDASEHVNVKLQACEEAWRGLIEKTRNRGDKLHQAADLQAYFDKYTELTAFVNELVAKVTSGELGRTVPAAEASLAKNNGYARQIESFRGVSEFVARGNQLVSQGHFMGEEIGERIKTLSARWEYLKNVTRERNELFTRNLDLRVYLAQLDEFERWLASKEPELRTLKLGESIAEVENLISEHEEWTHTLEAQESRVDLLRRRTLIEQAWEELRRREEAERELQAKRAEKERAEMLKRKEVERITQEINRKREDSDKDQQAHHNHQHGKEGKSGGGLLGSTRFGSFFGRDHGRRAQQQQQQNAGGDATAQPQLLSRSESLRLLNTTSSSLHPDATDTLKKPKRTPSFTTRRRTASFRNKKKHPENLPPTENEGYLERKHELQAGGKRAAVRSWKRTYVVLCGQLLCFFKDQEDFEMSKVGSSSPINVYQARCEVAVDYTKRKFVFRVKPTDGSEFLFAADAKEIMDEWVQKINFHAALEPKNQLDPMQQQQLQDGSNPGGDASQQHQSMMPPPPPPPKRMSEYSSTDEDDENQQQAQHHHHTRKPKPRNLQQQQPRSREPIYANHHEDTPLETDSVRSTTGKPPIPPRGDTAAMMPKKVRAAAADVPPRTSSLTASSGDLVPPPPPVNGRSPVMKQQQNGGAQDTVDNQQYFVTPPQRPVSVDRSPASPGGGVVHPLPSLHATAAMSPRSSGSLPPGMTLLGSPSPNASFLHGGDQSSSENEQGFHSSSPSPSPHAGGAPPQQQQTTDNPDPHHQATSSSSSSKKSKNKSGKHHHNKDESDAAAKDKESGGLMGLFRRKKATQL